MNSLQMSVTYTAVVKFSHSKTCFVSVPETWLREPLEIHVFKLLYGENKNAFVSCTSYKSDNQRLDAILISAKYAEKLNVKENEKVCLQPVLCSLPAVKEITLEPLTSDDWEILQLNARYIEQELMNRIRVVWLSQVFPVWVNNTSLYVRVAQTHPTSQPVLLVEFTEVHIVPKGRYKSSDSPADKLHSPNTERRTPNHLQFQHLRSGKKRTSSSSEGGLQRRNAFPEDSPTGNENRSIVGQVFSLFSSLLPAATEEKLPSLDESYRDFVPLNLEFILHVVPYSRPNSGSLRQIVQATTVFISAATYVALYGAAAIPSCFVAVIEKLQTADSVRKNQPKTNKDDSSHDSSSKLLNTTKESKTRTKNSSILNEEKQKPFDSVCVTVMVVKSAEEDEFNLPFSLFYSKDIIVVPKELKKCLNLEVSTLVHVKGVQSRPIPVVGIVLHPVSPLPSNVSNEILSSNFEKWAFGTNPTEASFTISDGTLVSLRLFGKKHDFFVSLNETVNSTLNSSVSSVCSTSPNSVDSEPRRSVRGDPKYGFIDPSNFSDIQVLPGVQMCLSVMVDRPYLNKPDALYQEIPAMHLNALGGISHLEEQALENLEFWLKLRPISYISTNTFSFSGCMLICGPKGIGKSAFANGLCKKLSRFPHYVHVKVIPCLPLKGKRVETIAKKWDDIVNEALCSQPSIILFEDLDYIASCPASHEQEVGADGAYFSSVVQTFVHMMNKIRESDCKVAVLVTSQSTHSLHPNLVNTKGRHIFQSIIEVHPPNAEQRVDILCSLVFSKSHISARTVDSVDWKKVASRTEGYVAQDLGSLVDRATHAAWVRMANSPRVSEITLNNEDFEMALEGYIPSSLRGIPLQLHDHKTWNDVGGLNEVKKTIQQIIMWPIKYKQIFKNYTLKPQMNILLYGAPGTGKTLLAGVIANECGLNFISIKGPELLSKYIGASEQAIRDLFKRASAARPCILFFDEFDSIAPRRGHDSTGVTDRVVNQLLTQLDGVESLEGVHVLAASSRPELIDPALLRPGRLDKCLLCPLPDEAERLEILKCLSSKLSMSNDIDFKCIAEKTEHFSGADIQALLYSANIEALHDVQSDTTRRYSTGSDDLTYSVASDKLLYMPTIQSGLNVPTYDDGKKIVQEVSVIKDNFYGITCRRGSGRHSTLSIVISQGHLLDVVKDMKPSVSPQERMRYETVFKNFQNGMSGGPVVPLNQNIKRVTLA